MTASTQDFGIPGVPLHPGDHLCALHAGMRERDDVLVPYLRAGLEAGDKCLIVVDEPEPTDLFAKLGGEDVAAFVASGALDVQTSSVDIGLSPVGFSPDELLAFWDSRIAPAMSGGQFSFARLGGEASWWLYRIPGTEELIRYESHLNRYMGRHPQAVLCMYDLDRFGGGIVVDMLKTHPKLLVRGTVIENPHYLSPDAFLTSRQEAPGVAAEGEILDWFADVQQS